jgi:hypothetical protein
LYERPQIIVKEQPPSMAFIQINIELLAIKKN